MPRDGAVTLVDIHRIVVARVLCGQGASLFERAIDVARAQHTRSSEFRARKAALVFGFDQGHCTEAHDLLAPIYGWFKEGLDRLDLKVAKELLEELAGQVGQKAEGLQTRDSL